jgi:hypothetical protein
MEASPEVNSNEKGGKEQGQSQNKCEIEKASQKGREMKNSGRRSVMGKE